MLMYQLYNNIKDRIPSRNNNSFSVQYIRDKIQKNDFDNLYQEIKDKILPENKPNSANPINYVDINDYIKHSSIKGYIHNNDIETTITENSNVKECTIQFIKN
jgi:hypothetical protein